LNLDATLLLLVGEDLPDAVARRIGVVLQPEFVVFVVGDSAPEPDGIDEVGRPAQFALAGQLDLIGTNARAMILPVDAGDVIERAVLSDREAEKAVAEYIGAAERFSGVPERRVRLFAVECSGLGRVWEIRRVRREEVRVARNAIGVRTTAERIGMQGDV